LGSSTRHFRAFEGVFAGRVGDRTKAVKHQAVRERPQRPAITGGDSGAEASGGWAGLDLSARRRYPPAARHCRSCRCVWPGRSGGSG
jgi:hypothetical protein